MYLLLHAEIAHTDRLDLASFVQFLHLSPRFIEGRAIGHDVFALVWFPVGSRVAGIGFVINIREGLWPVHEPLRDINQLRMVV